MLLVGLSGGVGSGKSTVARALANRGAKIIDTDEIARELVEPGLPAYRQIVDEFGVSVLKADRSLDRAALGALVFTHRDARRRLEAILHPLIRSIALDRVNEFRNTDHVVVLVVPLLVESNGAYPVDKTVVVDCDNEVAVERLVTTRNWSREHAEARIEAQASREARSSIADVVIDNSGSIQELEIQLNHLWESLLGR